MNTALLPIDLPIPGTTLRVSIGPALELSDSVRVAVTRASDDDWHEAAAYATTRLSCFPEGTIGWGRLVAIIGESDRRRAAVQGKPMDKWTVEDYQREIAAALSRAAEDQATADALRDQWQKANPGRVLP